MPIEDNRALIMQLYADGFNCQNAVAGAGFYALDASNHGVPIGRAGMQKVFEALFALFPDLTYMVETCVAEDDRVICRVLMTATHLGATANPEVYGGMLSGVAPTGRSVRVPQFHSFRIADGLILEHGAVRDDLGMLQQLGVIARPEV